MVHKPTQTPRNMRPAGTGLLIRFIILIAASLAGLPSTALSQTAALRDGTQTARLFGHVGPEPADESAASDSVQTVPAAPSPVPRVMQSPVVERERPIEPEPPVAPLRAQSVAVPTVTAPVVAAPAIEPPVSAAPANAVSVAPIVVPVVVPSMASLPPPAKATPPAASPAVVVAAPAPAAVPPVLAASAAPAAPPLSEPQARASHLFGHVGAEVRPDGGAVVAQAPGAGGAPVAPVPVTPQVQSKPAAAPVAPPPAAAVPSGPKFEIRSFDVEGATLISKERFAPLLRPFVGVNKDFGDVQQALEVVEKLFVSEGFGSVQVLLPEQELEQGAIKFKVVEPKVARILVEGNKEYSEANILTSLPGLKVGEAPNSIVIASNLRLANENPGKATTVLLRAGSNDGEVDAVVKVTEDKLAKFNYSFDNTGTDVTGRGAAGNYRHGMGASYANAFGLDHVIAAQVITSPQEKRDFRAGISKDVLILGVSYRIPLYESGNMLDFTAGYSNVNSGVVQGLFAISGRGSVFGVRLTQNLPRVGDYDHRLIYAADFRAYGNSVVQIGGPAFVPDITVKPVSLTYSGTYREATAESTGYLSFNQNLPGGGNGGSGQWEDNSRPGFVGARPGGRPGYTLWRYGFTHFRAFAGDWQARFNLTGQATKDRLIAQEQFGLGGAASVRGFVERQFSNDWGSYANFELYTPNVAQSLFLSSENKLRFLIFQDYGHVVRNGTAANQADRTTAAGAGFGLRLTHGNNLSIKLDAAWANRPSNSTGDTERPTVTRNFRMHGSLVYLF